MPAERDWWVFRTVSKSADAISAKGDSNKHRYVIATQSKELRERFRRIPGIPLVLLDRSVMVLETPSDATMRTKSQVRYHVYDLGCFNSIRKLG